MSNQHSCIYLNIVFAIYFIVGVINWRHFQANNRSIIKFGNVTLFSILTDLYLFGINLISTSKPSLSYP